jgi:lysozyme family protein
MPSYVDAIKKVHLQEGGSAYTNKATDTGGPTRWGVTQKAFDAWKSKKLGRPYKSTIDEIKNMSEVDSIAIYKEEYWDKIQGDKIKSYPVAYAIFDQAVNGGVDTIIKMVQNMLGLVPDGKAGAQFILSVNKVPEKQFLADFIKASDARYKKIVTNNPKQAPNLDGWMNRLKKVQAYVSANAGSSVVVGTGLGLILVLALASYLYITRPSVANYSSKEKAIYG